MKYKTEISCSSSFLSRTKIKLVEYCHFWTISGKKFSLLKFIYRYFLFIYSFYAAILHILCTFIISQESGTIRFNTIVTIKAEVIFGYDSHSLMQYITTIFIIIWRN